MGRIRLIGRHLLSSAEETLALGEKIGERLHANAKIALHGELGAGKTTFVQGICNGLGIRALVQSPTFTILNIYEHSTPFYHFDLYRLKTQSEFYEQGFDEFLEGEGICAIEWPERIQEIFRPTLIIRLEHFEQKRIVTIYES